jgi:adenylate kinase
MFKCVVFFGAPGAGKGTLASLIAPRFNLKHISTGDIVRAEISAGSVLGRRIKAIVEQGRLVDDETISQLLEKHMGLASSYKGFLLDGYPRTVNQAKLLEKVLSNVNAELCCVLYLYISEETAVHRLSSRVQCSKCGKIYNLLTNPPKQPMTCDECGVKLVRRKDDEPNVIRQRMRIFLEQSAPLIEYYKAKELLVKIDAEGSVQENAERVLRVLQKYFEGE